MEYLNLSADVLKRQPVIQSQDRWNDPDLRHAVHELLPLPDLVAQRSLLVAVSLLEQFPAHSGELSLRDVKAAVHRRDISLQYVAARVRAAQNQNRVAEYLIAMGVIRMEVAVDYIADGLCGHRGNR